MYVRPHLTLSALLLIFFMSSCQKEPTEIETSNNNYPLTIQPFFEEFELQARLRGMDVNLIEEGVSVSFINVNEDHVAGICTTNNYDLRLITIDIDFWNNSSHSLKEMVVFHELGHCFLGRGHREDAFANGICKSIMRSGLGSCSDAYTTQNRNYYLDELFFEAF